VHLLTVEVLLLARGLGRSSSSQPRVQGLKIAALKAAFNCQSSFCIVEVVCCLGQSGLVLLGNIQVILNTRTKIVLQFGFNSAGTDWPYVMRFLGCHHTSSYATYAKSVWDSHSWDADGAVY